MSHCGGAILAAASRIWASSACIDRPCRLARSCNPVTTSSGTLRTCTDRIPPWYALPLPPFRLRKLGWPSQAQKHGERTTRLIHLLETNLLVEMSCVIVGLHAKTHCAKASFTSGGEQRVEQPCAEPSPPPLRYDTHRDLRGGFVYETEAGIVAREESQPRRADWSLCRGDHAKITGLRPTCHVTCELRFLQNLLSRATRAIGPPERCFHQHLSQERSI